MIIAWHGEEGLKKAAMKRLRKHRKLDEIVQGVYFHEGRGCQLGCLTHVNEATHPTAERLFGIEQYVGQWLEVIFEGLHPSKCEAWVINSTNAIPVGADLSVCKHHFCLWALQSKTFTFVNDINRDVIERAISLHERALLGDVVREEWSQVKKQAFGCAMAMENYNMKHGDGPSSEWTWSARTASWATSCMTNHRYSGRKYEARMSIARVINAALTAASFVAGGSYYQRMEIVQLLAKESLKIFKAAPVVGATVPTAIAQELCCRKLWCPDDQETNCEQLVQV